MRHFLIIAAFLFAFAFNSNAQPESAVIGINGLTCSMCQKSVEKNLDRLKFIQSINSNLDSTSMTVTFKPGADVDISQLAQKVKSAGFTVRSLDVVFHFNQVAVADNTDFTYKNATYHFINVSSKTLNGETMVRIVGNEYMTRDEYKKYASSVTRPFNPFSPYYYVTLQ